MMSTKNAELSDQRYERRRGAKRSAPNRKDSKEDF